MSQSFVSYSTILIVFILIVSIHSYYYPSSYDKNLVLPNKRNILNWLKEHTNKHKVYTPHPDEKFDNNMEGNCKEIRFELNLGNNFIPSHIEYIFCHNTNDKYENKCENKDLICYQKTERMFIRNAPFSNCMTAPKEHFRPTGCECKFKNT